MSDTNVDKHQILEPITAISRLITLSFKPIGTKISIRDHKIFICEKNSETITKYLPRGIAKGVSQGVDRYWNGDSREDICILNNVIFKFIEWYVIPAKKTKSKIYPGLIKMAKFLCSGLRRLQRTYETGNVVLTIQYYINILATISLEDNNNYFVGLFYRPKNDNCLEFISDDSDKESKNELMYSTIFDVNKLKNFWSNEELLNLSELFTKCFDMNINNTDVIEVLDNDTDDDNVDDDSSENVFTTQKDTNSHMLANDKQNDKQYKFCDPVPKNVNNTIVSSCLVGITRTLDDMENKFKKLFEMSIRDQKI